MIIHKMEKSTIINDIEKIKAKFASYSIEELLQKGREHAKTGEYVDAFFAFNELFQREDNDKLRNLSELYTHATASLLYKEERKGINFLFEEELTKELEKRIVDSLRRGMMDTVNLHIDEKILSEDLFTLEKIVDLFPFNEIELTKSQGFQKIYNRFKEYALKVYIENQPSKNNINL